MNRTPDQNIGQHRFPAPVVCPQCRGELHFGDDAITCTACARRYEIADGFPDLIVGGRFDDPSDEALLAYEERSNEDLTRNYWLPTFARLLGRNGQAPRLLSLGCGTGVDVDILADSGYQAVGIDCGNRSNVWPRREHPERFLLANGRRLPFPDASFDLVFCGCVFPHVGVVGDSNRVAADYHRDRLELAQEMSRVLAPGGKVVVSSPNRWFLADIFHGRRPGSYKPRFNWPGDPFLLSVGDYIRLFRQAGCSGPAAALPVENYWGFIRSRNSLKGYVLGLPVRSVFWLVSRPLFSFLRASPLNPWLVVLVEK